MTSAPEPSDSALPNTTSPKTAEKVTESVLFVDDDRNILSSIRRLIRPLGLKSHFAESGMAGLDILAEHPIDLVVSDMRMPEMNGAAFLIQVKERWPDTVRMLLTGFSDINSTVEALNEAGIYRYISKPWDDQELKDIIQDGLKLKRLERERQELMDLTQAQNLELQDLNKNLEAKVEARTAEIRKTSRMLDVAYQDLAASYDSFVQVFSSVVNKRETLKRAESQVVADLAREMAVGLKLKEDSVKAVYYAALLHQIGKISFPDSLLGKAESEMTADEKQQYEEYPLIGEASLTAIHGLEKTAKFIRQHTELFNGSGYPEGLPSEKTLSGARIIRAVRDYIGLQTGILNSEKLKASEAFEKIQEGAGVLYDPIVVKCLGHFRKNYDIYNLYADEVEIHSHAMQTGMRLTRDLINSKGLLLIAKGHQLNTPVIEKILTLEKLEGEKFKLFVSREMPQQPDEEE